MSFGEINLTLILICHIATKTIVPIGLGFKDYRNYDVY